MQLIFVHGWSVLSLDTYGELPTLLADPTINGGLKLNISHLHLARYISFHNEVRMDDLIRAMDVALHDTLGVDQGERLPEFSAITHSTGGPLVKMWNRKHFAGSADNPLKHIVHMAPAMQGSALAKYAREKPGKAKALFETIVVDFPNISRVEPGLGVLEWLELGSKGIWDLAQDRLAEAQDPVGRPFEFSLIGDTVDDTIVKRVFKAVNERGSDGVIRVAGGNLNFSCLNASEDDAQGQQVVSKKQWLQSALKRRRNILHLGPEDLATVEDRAFQVFENTSHFQKKTGIISSITRKTYSEKQTFSTLLAALSVANPAAYGAMRQQMRTSTKDYQDGSKTSGSSAHKNSSYSMLVFRVRDDQGQTIDDYLMTLLTLSPKGKPSSKMPDDFFVDRHLNPATGQLVYYVDANKMAEIKKFAMLIEAFPDEGFAYYEPLEIRWTDATEELIRPNQTIFIDVRLKRKVTKQTFDFVGPGEKKKSFKGRSPGKLLIDGTDSVQ